MEGRNLGFSIIDIVVLLTNKAKTTAINVSIVGSTFDDGGGGEGNPRNRMQVKSDGDRDCCT